MSRDRDRDLMLRHLREATAERLAEVHAYRMWLLDQAQDLGILPGLMDLQGNDQEQWDDLARVLKSPGRIEEIRQKGRKIAARKERERKTRDEKDRARKRAKNRTKKVHNGL